MCPLCWESNVLLELDLTGLFNLASVGGPIKQDEINRGDSFSLICPAEFSLAKERMRKTVPFSSLSVSFF